VKSRSIITNANQHIYRRFVLNIDLENFFGTINFGRVRGLLATYPYNMPKKLATVIAHICCYKKVLPQGAPTSPIISNMICRKMDSELRRLAQRSNCRYTRYADDITFSCNSRHFPPEIAHFTYSIEKKRRVTIGDELRKIIIFNGFTINNDKSRLQTRGDRQEVTGLVTNKKLNINRRFIRNIRAMLYSWKAEGLQNATERHYIQHSQKHLSNIKKPTDIEQILRGRIEFIRSVRGYGFSSYITLAKKFNLLIGPDTKKLPLPSDKFLTLLNQNVFLIQNSTDIGVAFRMGTAFYLEEVKGFVTCYHVIEKDPNPEIKDDCEDFWIIHPNAPNKPYQLRLRSGRPEPVDIAIFDLVDSPSFFADHSKHEPLKLRDPFIEPQTDEAITLTGWPKFSDGDTVTIKRGRISSKGVKSSIKQLYITELIISGNSGGPVFDRNNRVVGIATRGNNKENAEEVAEHIAISADHILNK
jgi:retron-type reverse transcriptase